MEFRNSTKFYFYWNTEYELDGLLAPYPGNHPELATEFPELLLEKDNPCHVAAVETKIIYPNTITSAAADNSGIKNTPGVYADRNAPTSIFTINPTPEAKHKDKHKDNNDDKDNNDYD